MPEQKTRFTRTKKQNQYILWRGEGKYIWDLYENIWRPASKKTKKGLAKEFTRDEVN